MLTLGIAGLANVTGFLEQHFPEQMARDSRVVQGMDAAAALLLDGDVLAAASQERFDRVKKSGAFPFQAVRSCLDAAAATLDEVQDVCCNFNFGRYRPIYASEDLARSYWHECLSPDAIYGLLRSRFRTGDATRFHAIDHHDAHLHAALASSDCGRCLGLVMDAAGEIAATSVYLCEGPAITRLARYPVTQSLGMFYSLVTQFLGYAFNEDEYKVMGLASFGDPQRYREFFASAIRLGPNGSVEIPCLTLNRGFAEGLFFSASATALERELGIDGKDCSDQQRADLSAALQQRFTEALFHICGHYQKQTGATKLVFSGGCAENCAAIGELRSSGMFERIHVAYASGDEGTALGAAAACTFARGAPLRLPGLMPFFGPAPHLPGVRAVAGAASGIGWWRNMAANGQMLDATAVDIATTGSSRCVTDAWSSARAHSAIAVCSPCRRTPRTRTGSTSPSRSGKITAPSHPPSPPRMHIAISS